MADYTSSNIRIPPELSHFLVSIKTYSIAHFVVQSLPLQSVEEYSLTQHGNDFPRPSEHFVIADYLIDLPIIAVDLGAASATYGRVIGYAYADFWVVGDSLFDFSERLKTKREDAVWGKS